MVHITTHGILTTGDIIPIIHTLIHLTGTVITTDTGTDIIRQADMVIITMTGWLMITMMSITDIVDPLVVMVPDSARGLIQDQIQMMITEINAWTAMYPGLIKQPGKKKMIRNLSMYVEALTGLIQEKLRLTGQNPNLRKPVKMTGNVSEKNRLSVRLIVIPVKMQTEQPPGMIMTINGLMTQIKRKTGHPGIISVRITEPGTGTIPAEIIHLLPQVTGIEIVTHITAPEVHAQIQNIRVLPVQAEAAAPQEEPILIPVLRETQTGVAEQLTAHHPRVLQGAVVQVSEEAEAVEAAVLLQVPAALAVALQAVLQADVPPAAPPAVLQDQVAAKDKT